MDWPEKAAVYKDERQISFILLYSGFCGKSR